MIDVNVYLERWPFRRLPGDEPKALVAKLRQAGVTQAWCGSFDALLHRDVAAVNNRLASVCAQAGSDLLLPMGAVNPTLPDWQNDIERCVDTHRMRGLRLHPNYHGYTLDDPRFAELASLAAERKLLLQIAVTMEDERTQHPLVQVPHVDLAPLVSVVNQSPALRVVVLNGFRLPKVKVIDDLAATSRVWFDIATKEGVAGVEQLVKQVGHERVLFGSYFPVFLHESAQWKLKESPLGGGQVEAIMHKNAEQLWATTGHA